MERKIGEVFKSAEKMVIVIESDGHGCSNCVYEYNHFGCGAQVCFEVDRADGKSVIFKEVTDDKI